MIFSPEYISLFKSIFYGRQDVIVISTGQFFGEGVDLYNLECLVISYPFAFEGKLIQYIGRIQHSDNPPVIFDYRDSKIDYFEKMFKQRNRYYKKLSK